MKIGDKYFYKYMISIFISIFLLGGIMIEEKPWPIEVLVRIFKWFPTEERLQQLAPVCKLFHQAVHTPKLILIQNLHFVHFILFLGTLNI